MTSTMENGLLSLKWENHNKTFSNIVASLRYRDDYCDATISCDGKFYNVHKLVLSACSDYLKQMFERTNLLKSLLMHPVIILQDIRHEHLEALLDYIYVGEVNVLQADLAGLIRTAECLKIKGLAVPDDDVLRTFSGIEGTKRSIEEEISFEKRIKNETSNESDVSVATQSGHINEEDISANHNTVSDCNEISHRRLSQENVMLLNTVKEENLDPLIDHSQKNKQPEDQSQSKEEHYKTEQNKLEANLTEHQLSQIPMQIEPMRNSTSQVTTVSTHEIPNVSSLQEKFSVPTSIQHSEQYTRSWAPSGEQSSDQYSTAVVEFYSSDGQLLLAPVDGSKLWAQRGTSQCVICPFCSKSYNRKSAFLCHYKIHTGERPHVCPHCGHRFIQKSTLDAHIKTHTGEKPFSCPYCSFRFTRRSSVKDHILRRHKNESIDIVVSMQQ
ncbi:unnamed protein product, partial [Meganyctiphanes norvegica]|uniref:Uncharacterized protein n=1 Tax=Meganyctiphanes norvegica TaxID=48144 RepID=A0AAV2QII3_MEGNR